MTALAGACARALVARLHRAAERVGPARRPSGRRASGRGRECAGRRQVRRRPAPAPFPGAAPLSHRHHTITPLHKSAVAVISLYVPPPLRGAAPEGARRPPRRGGGPPHCGPQLGCRRGASLGERVTTPAPVSRSSRSRVAAQRGGARAGRCGPAGREEGAQAQDHRGRHQGAAQGFGFVYENIKVRALAAPAGCLRSSAAERMTCWQPVPAGRRVGGARVRRSAAPSRSSSTTSPPASGSATAGRGTRCAPAAQAGLPLSDAAAPARCSQRVHSGGRRRANLVTETLASPCSGRRARPMCCISQER